MKKGILILLAVLVLFSAVAVPSDAWAWRGHACCWGGWWWPGAFFGGLALGAALSYPYPYYYPQAPVIYEQPAAYVQQAPTYAAPPAPAMQREVVFPNGKYVLYGDGMSQPWRWVWVDAVPPVPPPPPQR